MVNESLLGAPAQEGTLAAEEHTATELLKSITRQDED